MIRENRKLTVVLAIALVAVWGAVVYRVVKAVDGSDADSATEENVTALHSASVAEYHYKADARDPFAYFASFRRDSIRSAARPIVPEPPWNPPPLRLIGTLINSTKRTAVVETADGETHYLGVHDLILGARILGVEQGRVTYSYRGRDTCWSLAQ